MPRRGQLLLCRRRSYLLNDLTRGVNKRGRKEGFCVLVLWKTNLSKATNYGWRIFWRVSGWVKETWTLRGRLKSRYCNKVWPADPSLSEEMYAGLGLSAGALQLLISQILPQQAFAPLCFSRFPDVDLLHAPPQRVLCVCRPKSVNYWAKQKVHLLPAAPDSAV